MVKFTATVHNAENLHLVTLKTGDTEQSIVVPPRASGFGSSINGAETLLLALATCYCNDIYREAKKQGVTLTQVVVEADCDWDGEAGHALENIVYHVTAAGNTAPEVIENLIRSTDTVAEIQNTVRQGVPVALGNITVKTGDSQI